MGERRYSIISDYLGTPIEAYDEEGQRVWARELDFYGRVHIEQGEVGLIPFLYQGQYLDTETGLAYNRFRYYSPETGAYISQDPIRLEAGLTNLYAYVHDVNAWIDPWELIKCIVYQAPELDATGNPTGKIYTGRTSGADEMSVRQILSKRKREHHRKNIVPLTPVYETDSYKAVRGGVT